MSKDDLVRLGHMLDAARQAIQFVRGKSRADLTADAMLALAIVKLLEIIGEASYRVSNTTQERFPDIPWKQLAGTRNRLIHGYFDVDLDIVWEILNTDLPPLIATLERIQQQ